MFCDHKSTVRRTRVEKRAEVAAAATSLPLERMIEAENQSDTSASRLGQQNEDLLVAGGNEVANVGDHEAGDQISAATATATTVEDDSGGETRITLEHIYNRICGRELILEGRSRRFGS